MENLLHAPIVLLDPMDVPEVPPSSIVGMMTFLGTTEIREYEVHLLLRFEHGRRMSFKAAYEIAIERVFGKDCTILDGNELDLLSEEWRVLVRVSLDRSLRNAKSFIHSKARKLAEAISEICEKASAPEEWRST